MIHSFSIFCKVTWWVDPGALSPDYTRPTYTSILQAHRGQGREWGGCPKLPFMCHFRVALLVCGYGLYTGL